MPKTEGSIDHRVLTRKNGWHERREHDEEQWEEKESRIVVGFRGIVADVQIEKTNQNTCRQVSYETQTSQRLKQWVFFLYGWCNTCTSILA